MLFKYKGETEDILKQVESNGFFIMKDAIDAKLIDSLRGFYLEELSKASDFPEVDWAPVIGDKDKICYSDDSFQCMYRGYSFPWNQAKNDSLSLMREVHVFRKRMLGLLKEDGDFCESVMDTCPTWTYYPPETGRLGYHTDNVNNSIPEKLIHFLVPLTFKGSDFIQGGLFMVDSAGNKIDVDAQLEKGDVLFFDGKYEHGVETIHSKEGVGRLQIFSIPTDFKHPADSDKFIATIPFGKYLKSKHIRAKVLIKNALFGGKDSYYNL